MAKHMYQHLDRDGGITVDLSLRQVAERVAEMNHGVHRLMSHMVDVRRERLAKRIAEYRARGDADDIAESVARRGDTLADVLEKWLAEGGY